MSDLLKLRVGGVPEHFNLPWHQTIASGAFEEAGLDVEFIEVPGGTGVMVEEMRKRNLDLAVMLTEGAVKAITHGNSFRIIQEYVRSPLLWGIHTGNQSKIEDLKELNGAKFAISRKGSGSHLMAHVDAEQRGWDAAKLRFVEVGTLDGAVASLNSEESELFLWEKFTTSPLVEQGVLKRVGETPTPWPCFVIVVRNETLINHHEAVAKLLDCINAKCKQFKKAEDSIQQVASKYGLKVAQVEEWFRATEWATARNVSKKALKNTIETLVDLKLLEQHIKPEKVCCDLTVFD